jgi:hypothetical protein
LQEQVESLFLEAIRGAANKAPIYVSLGDYCAGGRASKTLQVLGVAEGISELKPEAKAREESSTPSDANVSDGEPSSAWGDLERIRQSVPPDEKGEFVPELKPNEVERMCADLKF